MGTIQEAKRILVEAEGSLRHLIEQGLREQRYGDVAEIAVLAEGLSRLLQGHRGAEDSHRDLPTAERAPKVVTPPTKRPRGHAGAADYPRFERDGDKLIKIAWSKKNKAAYEHRAPREAVIAFARHLSGTVSEGKVFVVEDLMPVPDVANGGEIPAYQIYLTLGWFRRIGVVEKKGRDGYVLRRAALGDGALDRLWAGLPARAA
jgi:hypothetical protein